MKQISKNDIIAFIKFVITGGMNTFIDFVIFFVLSGFFSVNKYIAQFFAYSCGTLNSYIINRSWTFKSKEKALSPQLIKFVIANTITLGLSLLLLNIFTQRLMLSNFLGKLITTGFTTIFNFILSRLWVFKSK